jgi:hypothetical protein
MASGYSMRLKVGEKSPSMQEAATVNEHVLEPIESLVTMSFIPADAAKLTINGAKATLDFTKLKKSIQSGDGGKNLISGVYVMVNGTRYLTNILTDGTLTPA